MAANRELPSVDERLAEAVACLRQAYRNGQHPDVLR